MLRCFRRLAEGPEYEAAWSACKDVVRFQCRSSQEVVTKAKGILSHGWLLETAEVGIREEGYWFRDFLKTLIPT
jgi:hypothetical protein